jgi:hypothetical protein
MGGDGIISHALVEGNVIYNNGRAGGSGINCDGVQHSRIQNNVIYNNHASGISLYMIDAAEPAKYDTVVNNTILQASDGRWCLNIKNGSNNTIIVNNILYNYHASRGSISIDEESMTGLKSDFNIVMNRLSPDDDNTVMTLTQWKTTTSQDSHSLIAAPDQLFVNTNGNNFTLNAGSLAIDVGTELFAPTKDRIGVSRPQNLKFDIGAYEYSTGSVPIHTPQQTLNELIPRKISGKNVIVDLSGRVVKNRIIHQKNHSFKNILFKIEK